ncbi:AraC family transcriptional regulator [Anoxybacterium hadale]|uniref:AraC family transcriptional regulator n=1 Tax=Anoxybacterium hadale TaxID=3408580 RepID=A0ACD1A9C6_9FIRM|nr:AraC family transcriptional regulator [Clostridiales bacterium]
MDKNFYNTISFMQHFQKQSQFPVSAFLKAVNSTPIHMHDGMELLYVLSGAAQVKISFHTFELRAGDFLLINQFEVHKIQKLEEECVILFLQCDETIFGDEARFFAFDPFYYRNYHIDQVEILKKSMVEIYLSLASDQRLLDVPGGISLPADKISAIDPPTEKVSSISLLTGKIAAICLDHFQMQHFKMTNRAESPFSGSNTKLERVENTIRYIYKEFDHKIMLHKVAKREYIDKYYASHLIKAGTGAPFQEMLSLVRADRAEVLLLGTEMNLSEIAEAVGFSSYQYFVKQFRFYFGMLPQGYRKQYQPQTYPNIAEEDDLLSISEEDWRHQLASKYQIAEKTVSELVLQGSEMEEFLGFLIQEGVAERFLGKKELEVSKIIFQLKEPRIVQDLL